MGYVCDFTGKKPSYGKTRTYRGQKIVKGGFGLKPTGISRRRFRPNIQKMRIVLEDGTIKTARVSTNAIRSGLVIKPLKRKFGYTRQQNAE